MKYLRIASLPPLTATASLAEIQVNNINILEIHCSYNEILQSQKTLLGKGPCRSDRVVFHQGLIPDARD